MLIFRYTCSIFDGDSEVTLTKTLFLLGDSNITTPCPLHLLEQIMAKQSIMVTHSMPIYSGDRDTRGEEGGGEVGKSAQIALAPERFLDSQTRPIDLSRARRRTLDTSRTTRHARHVTHGTARPRQIPGGGTPASLPYHTPNLRSNRTFWMRQLTER